MRIGKNVKTLPSNTIVASASVFDSKHDRLDDSGCAPCSSDTVNCKCQCSTPITTDKREKKYRNNNHNECIVFFSRTEHGESLWVHTTLF